jgi:hypothetical protein
MLVEKNQDVDNFLFHFGVKGMHWGQVHDNTGISPRREAKAKRLDAHAEVLTKSARDIGVKKNVASKQYILRNGAKNNRAAAKDVRAGKLTRNEKIAIGVGAAAGVAIGAALLHKYGGVNYSSFASTINSARDAVQAKVVLPRLNVKKPDPTMLTNKINQINALTKPKAVEFNPLDLPKHVVEARDQARDYWLSDSGKEFANEYGLDISQYSIHDSLDRVKDKLSETSTLVSDSSLYMKNQRKKQRRE